MLVGGVNQAGRVVLSGSEKEYISLGVSTGLRGDGRACHEWRPFNCELHPVPQAAGSARVRLGGTDVLVSIKGDIGRPVMDTPDEGQIICTVDSSTVFSMNSQNSGVTNEERLTADRNTELTAILSDVLIRSGVLDKRILGLVHGQYCWIIYIDVLVADYDGNLIDAMFMACRLALGAMRLPGVRVEEGGESTEIVLAEDIDDARVFSPASLPLCITVALIGDGLLVDPSAAEELCCQAALLVMLLPDGKIVAVRKLGCGLVDPGRFGDYLAMATGALGHCIRELERTLMAE